MDVDPHGHDGHEEHHHDHHGHGHEEHGHHGQDHHGHTHGVSVDADFRLLGIALSLLASFMLVEVVVGVIAHSIALISDAGHMVTDLAALGVGMYVTKLAKRAANDEMTYGFRRAEVLSGFGNGLTMVLLAAFLAYQTIMRLLHPVPVHGWLVVVVGAIGIVVNYVAVKVTGKANRESMNIEGSFRHMLSDMYAFIGTVAAGVLILVTHVNQFDSIMSLIVAALMVRGGYPLVKDATRVFLQVTPESISVHQLEEEILSVPGILAVHCVHVWEIVPGVPVFTVNAIVDDNCAVHSVQDRIQEIAHEHGLNHHTIHLDAAHEGVQPYNH